MIVTHDLEFVIQNEGKTNSVLLRYIATCAGFTSYYSVL